MSPLARRRLRLLHRLLGLLIGLQLLFWIGGGLVMSAFRLETVRGADLAAPQVAGVLQAERIGVPLDAVLRRHAPEGVQSASLQHLRGRPVYRLQAGERVIWIEAGSGEPLAVLEEHEARQLALTDYRGSGALTQLERLDEVPAEARGRSAPLWRARFDDARATTLYLDGYSGQVVARRNHWWRVFDFVWMLHIMDYRERENFNHPLLILAAASALLFTLSGFTLLGLHYLGAPRR
ncbi:MAG TPA: hypothetical protein VFV27_03195 [Nevskiaceae bacterium]|nr:hypothetical protein [Nevskiaceae bacterium]